jgi:hypothetical protein
MSRGQASVEEQKARRQAYSSCSTTLLARRDAAAALLDTFLEDAFDLVATQVLLQNLDEQRDGVARAVGAVAVEDPYAVAYSAQIAARAVQAPAGRLRNWVASVAGGRDREQLVDSQMRYGLDHQREVHQRVEDFAAECRKVLHPDESSMSALRWL